MDPNQVTALMASVKRGVAQLWMVLRTARSKAMVRPCTTACASAAKNNAARTATADPAIHARFLRRTFLNNTVPAAL